MKFFPYLAVGIALVGCSPPPATPEVKGPRPNFPVVIRIEGAPEDEEAINSWLKKLQEGFDSRSHMPPSPFLGPKDPYKGHIFWDSDVWHFPALALLDPERARKVSAARLDWRAEYSASIWYWEIDESNNGAVVPAAELHRSGVGSAYWMLQRAGALGLIEKDAKFDFDLFPKEAAEYFRKLSVKTERGWELKGVKSIDEYAEKVDNDLYTNLVAQNVTGLPYYLPSDETSLLTYDNDPVRNYQQAAAVLAIFPLQIPEAENQAKTMMERFASKTNPKGPAMTDSIHATIYARIGETEKAYETWNKSWQDFQRETLPAKPDTPIDLNVFSEYRTQTRSYFLTGAAGCMNAVLYGFCGFRIDSRTQPGAAWTKQLNGGYWLSIKPQLPKQWRSITVPFTLLGKKYTLVATHEKVTVNQGDP